MKKIILMAFVLASSSAFAAHYGAAGCGLGSQLFKENGKIEQILGATTNGFSGTQTFGITSGTSNCTDDGRVAANMQVPLFVEVNRQALARDIARGSGETLSSFSAVLGCDNANLGPALQKNYGRIFPSETASVEQVSNAILNVVHEDSSLSKTCASNS